MLTTQASRLHASLRTGVSISSRAAMGHLQCTLPLVMQLLLVLIPAAHAAGARTLLQGNSNSTKTTTNAAASAASHPANCTPPRTLKDTKKPFCVVPDNVSPGAREFLSQAAAGGIPWDIGSGNATGRPLLTVYSC